MPDIYVAIDEDRHLLVNTEWQNPHGQRLSLVEGYPIDHIPVGVSAWLTVLEKK